MSVTSTAVTTWNGSLVGGDGSVRFIKNTIDTAAWWAVGSINGGEVVSADSF